MFGMSLMDGRYFDAGDEGGDRVAVVSELLARELDGESSVVGRRFRVSPSASDGDWIRIIGVTTDPGISIEAGRPLEGIFFPSWDAGGRSFTVLGRSGGDGAATLQSLTRTVGEVDPNLALTNSGFLDRFLLEQHRPERVFGLLFLSFGIAALMLAIVGLYGVIAFNARRRRREAGVRRALGAEARDIQWWIAKTGMVPVGIGLLAGLGIGRLLTSVMGEMLFGTDPGDPVVFTLVPLVLALGAAFSLWLPAREAARVDPMSVLRGE